jgi:phospholipase D-like protein/putative oligomerization/nucleic acid binding protein
MPIAASDYPFLDVMWTMFVFFVWVLWFWLLFTILTDVFRRHDLSGWGKTGWVLFCVILPYIGVFAYVITQNQGMNERRIDRARAQREQFDDYVRTTAGDAGGAAAEIDRAKQLLDSGVINDAEFQTLKQKALAA